MTEVVQIQANPQAGLEFSEAALAHLQRYLAEQSCLGLRLSVKRTGCSGLSYVLDYVQSPEATDLIFPLVGPYSVYVDKASYPYLKGMKMDYIKQGFQAKFVFSNPNQTGECGCGESFTVD